MSSNNRHRQRWTPAEEQQHLGDQHNFPDLPSCEQVIQVGASGRPPTSSGRPAQRDRDQQDAGDQAGEPAGQQAGRDPRQRGQRGGHVDLHAHRP